MSHVYMKPSVSDDKRKITNENCNFQENRKFQYFHCEINHTVIQYPGH